MLPTLPPCDRSRILLFWFRRTFTTYIPLRLCISCLIRALRWEIVYEIKVWWEFALQTYWNKYSGAKIRGRNRCGHGFGKKEQKWKPVFYSSSSWTNKALFRASKRESTGEVVCPLRSDPLRKFISGWSGHLWKLSQSSTLAWNCKVRQQTRGLHEGFPILQEWRSRVRQGGIRISTIRRPLQLAYISFLEETECVRKRYRKTNIVDHK